MPRIIHGVDGSSREVPDDDRSGRCFELAVTKVREEEGSTLIHGTIQGPHHPPIHHAWVILRNGRTWEPRTDASFTAAQWKAFANPVVLCRHPRAQAVPLVVKHDHFGPWPECHKELRPTEKRRCNDSRSVDGACTEVLGRPCIGPCVVGG